MRYLLFIVTDPDAPAYVPEEDNIEEWFTENSRAGTHIMGDRLRPVEDATTVRVRDGETVVTDGPFTESKEWIAGFDILECESLDQAIDIASKHPMARFGKIEIRPFWPFED